MVTQTYTSSCLSNKKIAQGIWEFELEKPEGFTFKPGQFVLFSVPLVDDPLDIQTRAFSIASAPNENTLLFVAKILDGGRASRWIEELLQEGSAVEFQGPIGLFTLKEEVRDIVMIGTSTGIAPFRSQIIEKLNTKSEQEIHLVYGVRSQEDLFWQEELQELAASHENVHVHIALTKPEGEWEGLTGRVQQVTPRCIEHLLDKCIYICGNPDMTKEVKRMCLEEWGVPKEQVHMEGYV